MNAASRVGEEIAPDSGREPLPTSPMTARERFVVKCLSAVLPGWRSRGACSASTAPAWQGGRRHGPARIGFDVGAAVLALIAAPLLGGVASFRTTAPRTAQQLDLPVILPVSALFVAQLTGLYLLSTGELLAGCGVLLLLAASVLCLGGQTFLSEEILRWWR